MMILQLSICRLQCANYFLAYFPLLKPTITHNILYPNSLRISRQFGIISEQGSHIHPSARTPIIA
jgi:hypothetical protein